ncbi:MAG: PKD domain-containing protein, partial [Bacteroidota bacterium]
MNRSLLLLLCFQLFSFSLSANETMFDAAFGFSYENCTPSGVTIAFEDQSTSAGITAWLWEFSDGQSSSEQNPTITITSDQMLGVRLTITLADGSTEVVTQTLNVVLMENVQLPGSLLLCPGGAIPLNPRGNQEYSYSWSPATGLNNPNAANPIASPDETTTYTVTITDDSGSGVCQQVKSVTVTVPPEIPFELGEDFTTCEDEVTLTVDTDPINTINWFDVNANLLGSGETITVTLQEARTVFFVEIIDEPGCSVKDAIVVTKGETPTVNAQPNNPSCGGESTG